MASNTTSRPSHALPQGDSMGHELLDWAVNEMKFDSSPYMTSSNFILPTQKDMEILCNGPMVNIWKFFTQHVRSRQHGLARENHKHVKQSSGVEGNLGPLHEAKARLCSALSTCQSDIELLEGELQHSTAEIAQLERQYQSVRQRVGDLQRKESLLSVVASCAEDTLVKYREFSGRIAQRTRDISYRGTDSADSDQFVRLAQRDDTEQLESEGQRDVRTCCSSISHMHHDVLSGKLATDQKALERCQQELWAKVKRTASSRRVHSTLRALVDNTQIASGQLRDQTVGLDIARDAQNLSFSYKSSGKLEDVSWPPGVEKSVQQLLLASNREHMLRFFQEQEQKNESWKLEARLDDLMAEIDKLLQHHVMVQHQPLARKCVDSLISAAVEKSVLPCLRVEMDGLVDRVHQAKQEREELHSMHACILKFKDIVEKKQNLIAVLARSNTNRPNRLQEQREKVSSYVESHALPSHDRRMNQMADSLRDSLSAEVDRFSALPLPCLLSVQLDSTKRVSVTDLSLTWCTHPLVQAKSHTLLTVSDTLDFPGYKSADRLPIHLLSLHRELLELRSAQACRDYQVKAARAEAQTTDDIQAIVDLCEGAKAHLEAQCGTLMPKLENCQKHLNSLSLELGNVEDLVQIWSDQPAQFTTPWVTSEGMTFDQWMQRWRVTVTQLHIHKLMAAKSHK